MPHVVHCNFCDAKPKMRFIKSKRGQHARDITGKLIEVTRLFYCCPACNTVAWFDMREDGKQGDLHKMVQAVKATTSLEQFQQGGRTIGGSINKIDG